MKPYQKSRNSHSHLALQPWIHELIPAVHGSPIIDPRQPFSSLITHHPSLPHLFFLCADRQILIGSRPLLEIDAND
jgi:hypothetical protein